MWNTWMNDFAMLTCIIHVWLGMKLIIHFPLQVLQSYVWYSQEKYYSRQRKLSYVQTMMFTSILKDLMITEQRG